MAATRSIPGTGIKFRPGGLHRSLGVPQGQPIPPAKVAAAAAGDDGPKAQKQALLARTLEHMHGKTPRHLKGKSK